MSPEQAENLQLFADSQDVTGTMEGDSIKAALAEVERLKAHRKHYRSVLNLICDMVGHPRISPDELSAESVAESVRVRLRHMDDLSERLEAVTPSYLARFAASLEHHEEHHQRERELEAEVERLRAELDAAQQEPRP